MKGKKLQSNIQGDSKLEDKISRRGTEWWLGTHSTDVSKKQSLIDRLMGRYDPIHRDNKLTKRTLCLQYVITCSKSKFARRFITWASHGIFAVMESVGC